MLPRTKGISESSYRPTAMPQEQTVQQRYRLGLVRQSSIRDLNVVQAYIWLCCLENSFSIIEQELLPACLAVLSPKPA